MIRVPRFLDASFEIMRENQMKAIENFKTMANPLAGLEERGRGKRAGEADSRVESELDELKRTVAELQMKVADL